MTMLKTHTHTSLTKVSQITSLLLSSLVLTAPVIAGSHGEQLPLLDQKKVSSDLVSLPINNELFLYGNDALNFDLNGYLSQSAPILLQYQEMIAHWSGYYSINPKVVLTLIELYSGLISNPDEAKLSAPFNNLSDKIGFSEQLQDILLKLSTRFYQYEQSQISSTNQASIRKMGTMHSATAALNSLEESLKPSSRNIVFSGNTLANNFTENFSQLFEQNINILTAKSASKSQPSQTIQTRGNTPPIDMMQLPWRVGYSWISNGAHSNTGSGYPFSSIDVSYDWPNWGATTYSVASAHSGTVRVLSNCQVRITNSNGWATNYYHMDKIQVSNGEYVGANTKLGIYANNQRTALCQGGSSTGPHLHFSLLKNGRYVSLQDVNFGEFQVNVGQYNYDNSCNRFYFTKLNNNGYKCAWSSIYNSGTY